MEKPLKTEWELPFFSFRNLHPKKESEETQLAMHRIYRFLVVFSFIVFFGAVLGPTINHWELFYLIYFVLALTHTWFIFLMLFKSDLSQKVYPKYAGEKISVIVPCFNEDPVLLNKAVQSVVRAKGNKEIIVINDGSTNKISNTLQQLQKRYGILVHEFSVNKGKRFALHFAVKHLITDSKFIFLMDSDTILDKHAIVNLVRPLKKSRIGAASGDVKLLNENRNLVTKMVGAYYWVALNIHRKAQSGLGMVDCCSGAVAAYKTSIMKNIIDDIFHQKFLGKNCTYAEDRHLTNLTLRLGFDVVFVPTAVAHTYTPHTIKGFMKQQQRWRRGFIQESIFALSFMWKRKPLLFIEILLWHILLPFISTAIVALMLIVVITQPILFFFSLLPFWIVIMLVRNLPLVFYARRKLSGLLLFTLFSNFVLYWQGVYALFTPNNRGWNTR